MKTTLNIIAILSLLLLKTSAQSLQEQLEAQKKASAGKLSDEIQESFKEGILSVKESKIVEGAKKTGDIAPGFTLKNATGQAVDLDSELKKGPVVLTWYRGGWCPYCNIAMAAMQSELPAIKEAGASLIALTPELPDNVLTTKEKNDLKFQVLTDLNHKVADQYGLLFELTPEVEKIYGSFFDLNEYNGEEAGTTTLPLTATYVIGEDRKILWAFVHYDYRKRAEPTEIVKFLNSLKSTEAKEQDRVGKD